MRFSGRTVLVTGAGSGIGRATVELFLASGARVVAVELDGNQLATLGGPGDDIVRIEGDVTDPGLVNRSIDAAGERLDVLCNNAGIIDRNSLVDETSDELWDRIIAVNLTAPFRFTREAVRRMLPQGGGVIVNTASIASVRGGRAGASYTASKHGLVGLTLNIAATLGHDGIRCNAVCPGGTVSSLWDDVDISPRGAERIKLRDRRRPDSATAEQVASVICFLASDEASHVNGALVPVDNGTIAY